MILQGALAKKPYNPILGEIFNCSFDVREECSTGIERNPLNAVNDVPPAEETREVRFYAEQVSHHPPGRPVKIAIFSLLTHTIRCFLWVDLELY